MIHHMNMSGGGCGRIRKGIVIKVVQSTGVQIELEARSRDLHLLPLLLLPLIRSSLQTQTHRRRKRRSRPILSPPFRVINRDGVWISQRTESVLEDGGQVRVARVYDLSHILDELGY